MNILNKNDIHILDLPDEILQLIFKKLNLVDIIYSLMDINQRFRRLALDPLYIDHLDFSSQPSNISNSSVDIEILDRICEQILPQTHEKVKKLTVTPYSAERVLHAVNYPQLYSLSFVNFQANILIEHVTDRVVLHLLTNQIRTLTVNMNLEKTELSIENQRNIFKFILEHGRYLNDLIFFQKLSTEYFDSSSFNKFEQNPLSFSLTKLTINVKKFDDCLYILNGSLPSLSTLNIHVDHVNRQLSLPFIDNTKKLFQLKCFSLVTSGPVGSFNYDGEVVRLLQRMINLEKLTLFMSIIKSRSSYIDGNQLYDQVVQHMPRLDRFTFSIHTSIIINASRMTTRDLPCTDDIRNSFVQRGIQSIDVYSHDELVQNRAQCHAYSLPYEFDEFFNMSNCFRGGKFDKVRLLSMNDNRPFEHELFQIISRDFPFLRTLTIFNHTAQTNQSHHSLTLITFHYLTKLSIANVHDDYVVQFLSDQKTRLLCLTDLVVDYKRLVNVTKNFTNDATRLNCSQIKSLQIYQSFVHSLDFVSYFPCLK